jgi:D-alanine-D-alanine ligase
LAAFDPAEWLVFNLCEGSPYQAFYYARVAGELERRGYAFTGSGSAALHETQLKPAMKRLLEARDVPTPSWTESETGGDLAFGLFPAIVKPAAEHCSFGITRDSVVFTLAEARERATVLSRQYPGGVIVEEFLDSEEYAVSLWGPEHAPEVLGISLIRYDAFPELRDRLCTFDAKWLPETEAFQKTPPSCSAPIPRELRAALEDLARRAHTACQVRDYGRVDIRLRSGEPMVLDVNANCDLGEHGGFAHTANSAGWEYDAMLERLVLLAAARQPEGVPA